MKSILAAFTLFALLLPASALPGPTIAQKEEPSTGWWASITEKKWEVAFAPGDIRYGLRVPIYPLVAGIVVIAICAGAINSAKRKNQPARVPAGIYILTLLGLIALAWKSSFSELRNPPKHVFEWQRPEHDPFKRLENLKLPSSTSPDSLFNRDNLKPGSRAADLLKEGLPSSNPAPPSPIPPTGLETPPKPPGS
jgi:hypothetical protein